MEHKGSRRSIGLCFNLYLYSRAFKVPRSSTLPPKISQQWHLWTLPDLAVIHVSPRSSSSYAQNNSSHCTRVRARWRTTSSSTVSSEVRKWPPVADTVLPNRPRHSDHRFPPSIGIPVLSSFFFSSALPSSRCLRLHLHTMPILDLFSQHLVHQPMLLHYRQSLELRRDYVDRVHRSTATADVLDLKVLSASSLSSSAEYGLAIPQASSASSLL